MGWFTLKPKAIKSKPVATDTQAQHYTARDMSPDQDCLTFLLVQNPKYFDMQAIKKKCSYQNSTINVTSSSRHIFLMPFPIRLKKWELTKNLHLYTLAQTVLEYMGGCISSRLSWSSPTTTSSVLSFERTSYWGAEISFHNL